jgi:flagellar protein FlaG
MNIQQTELSRDAAALALEAERAIAATKHEDEKVQETSDGHEDNGSGQPGGSFSREEAEKLSKQAEQYFGDKGVKLHFKVLDDDGGSVQVEMLDASSQKVIRKIPQDELVTLSESIKRMAKGVLDKAV